MKNKPFSAILGGALCIIATFLCHSATKAFGGNWTTSGIPELLSDTLCSILCIIGVILTGAKPSIVKFVLGFFFTTTLLANYTHFRTGVVASFHAPPFLAVLLLIVVWLVVIRFIKNLELKLDIH